MEKIDYREVSFSRVPNFIIKEINKSINTSEFAVYSYLISKMNNSSKECVISTSKIAEELTLSRRTVSNILSNLHKLNYIGITPRYRRDGGRVASKYTILNK